MVNFWQMIYTLQNQQPREKMLTSMTAYGRATHATSVGRFTAEIQSVNRKHLDIQVQLSKELNRFEPAIRKVVTDAITRGHVSVKLFVQFEKSSPIAVTPNLPLAREIKGAWEKIAKELGLSEKISLDLLAAQPDILLYNDEMADEELYRQAVVEVIQKALDQFVAMRKHEGLALHEDIARRIKHLAICIDQVALKAPTATEKHRQKLIERINEVVPGAIENEERILREVCLYAEKADIAEEITRFKSHIQQCEELMSSNADHVGKTFEFLLQEMGREVNTIGSKSSDIVVLKVVIDMKSELERIREQIQNVE